MVIPREYNMKSNVIIDQDAELLYYSLAILNTAASNAKCVSCLL